MKNPMVIGLVVVLCVLAFVGGFWLFGRGGSQAPATQGSSVPAERAGAAVPVASTVAPAAVVAEPKEPTLAEQMQNFESPLWRTMNNGCTTDITKDEIRIHGLSQFADWAHSNGIVATTPIPDGDFTLSVEIKIAKYAGTTQFKNPYIRVEARDRSAIGIFANPDFFYRLHDWKNPQTMSSTHPLFGNEATTYHRMSLHWQEATGTAIATVDKELIGTIKTNLGTGRRISLFANTETKGVDIDVYFRNLKVETVDTP